MEDKIQYLYGFLTTSIIKTIVAPLERYRLIRQTQDILTLSHKEKMTNFYQYITKTIKNEGIKAFWRSNLTTIYIWFPQVFAQCVFYQNIKQATYDNDILSQGLCATLCGVTTSLFSYPFDTIKVRQATEIQLPHQKRIFTTFEETRFNVKLESGVFKGLYSGFSIGCVQTLLLAYSMVGLKSLLQDQQYAQEIAYLGAFALTYPIDSIKHRLQVKSILFQQEAAKKVNLLEKLKFNLKEWSFSWGFGGFFSHNIRAIAIIFMMENVNFEQLYGEITQKATQLKY